MRLPLSFAFAIILGGTALAAKATRFWNLTDNTITNFTLAPTGTETFGANQAKNDKDGAVDHDERLKILDVKTGRYDAKFIDNKGRQCLIKAISIKEGEVFSIEEKQLTDCKR